MAEDNQVPDVTQFRSKNIQPADGVQNLRGGSILDDPEFGSLAASRRRDMDRNAVNRQMHANKKLERAYRVGYRSLIKSGRGGEAARLMMEAQATGNFWGGKRMAGEAQSKAADQVRYQRTFQEETLGKNSPAVAELQRDVNQRVASAPDEAQMSARLQDFWDGLDDEKRTKDLTGMRRQLAEFAPLLTSGNEEQRQKNEDLMVRAGRFLGVEDDQALKTFDRLNQENGSMLRSEVGDRVKSIFQANPMVTTARARQVLLNEILGKPAHGL